MIEVVLDTRPAAARLDYRRASRSKAASAATEKRREIVSLNGEKEPLKQFGAISLRSFLAAPMADKGYAKLFAMYASGQHPRRDDYREALRQQRRPLTVGSPSNSREAIR